MSADDELFAFAEEDSTPEVDAPATWRVLVVDDEPQVHAVTELALDGVRVDGSRLTFEHAYDGAQARAMLEAQTYALVLLDVVMATDDDGLRLVHWLRRERLDRVTRIVLRTGQPGFAPEREVMLEYDINDYQPKSELSAQRLATSVIGAIRSFRDIKTIHEQNDGLENIVRATTTLFDRRSTEQLVSGVLQQLAASLGSAESAMFFLGPEPEAELVASPVILAATGHFSTCVGKRPHDVLPAQRTMEVDALLAERANGGGPGWSLYSMSRASGLEGMRAAVYIESRPAADAMSARLTELFCNNAAVAFENQRLSAQQQRLLGVFGRFVPRRLLDAVGFADLSRVAVGAHVQREMSVMFVDVRAFSRITEDRGAAEAFRLLNRLFGEIVPVIHAHGGVVDKFLGDGLLSVFPDAREGALRAAVSILDTVNRVAAVERDRGGETLDVGIGIHRGPTILGVVGADDRLESTVVSDAVNTASRLERLTRSFGARIVVSAEALGDDGTWRARTRWLGSRRVRGKVNAVSCFELFEADAPDVRASKAATRSVFEAAVQALEAGRYEEAERALAELVAQHPSDAPAAALADIARSRDPDPRSMTFPPSTTSPDVPPMGSPGG